MSIARSNAITTQPLSHITYTYLAQHKCDLLPLHAFTMKEIILDIRMNRAACIWDVEGYYGEQFPGWNDITRSEVATAVGRFNIQ